MSTIREFIDERMEKEFTEAFDDYQGRDIHEMLTWWVKDERLAKILKANKLSPEMFLSQSDAFVDYLKENWEDLSGYNWEALDDGYPAVAKAVEEWEAEYEENALELVDDLDVSESEADDILDEVTSDGAMFSAMLEAEGWTSMYEGADHFGRFEEAGGYAKDLISSFSSDQLSNVYYEEGTGAVDKLMPLALKQFMEEGGADLPYEDPRQEKLKLEGKTKTAQRGYDEADLDALTYAYKEAALWTSNSPDYTLGSIPEDLEHGTIEWEDAMDEITVDGLLDAGYGPDDIAPDCAAAMEEICRKFMDKFGEALADVEPPDAGYSTLELAGHDLFLTRHGHGAGFWDRDWPEPLKTQMDKFAYDDSHETNMWVDTNGVVNCDMY
jgi:hypothetical protein